ncbi:J domain-containing protein [Thermodesulfatator autotrophicus]|nr:J domain-containing protein [Thermodesulfatator autotrophicus]
MSLGKDPSRFIVYPGGNSFYIKEEVIENLAQKGVKTDQWELEKIFWPFVKPHIRQVIENFSAHQTIRSNRLSAREQLALQREYHIFDCRRLLFLKFGGTDVDFLLKRPLGFLNILHEKSRDEIEQHIMAAEQRLRPRETLAYIYTAFGLAKHFSSRLSRHIPEAQVMEKIDDAFLAELCLLLEDKKYLMGLEPDQVLKDYLSRYAIMYFDRLSCDRRFFEEREARLLERYRNDLHKVAREAAAIFGVSPEEILRLNKEEISSLFRRKARELHPDQGGDHEAFIKLHKLYEELMKLRGYRKVM